MCNERKFTSDRDDNVSYTFNRFLTITQSIPGRKLFLSPSPPSFLPPPILHIIHAYTIIKYNVSVRVWCRPSPRTATEQPRIPMSPETRVLPGPDTMWSVLSLLRWRRTNGKTLPRWTAVRRQQPESREMRYVSKRGLRPEDRSA